MSEDEEAPHAANVLQDDLVSRIDYFRSEFRVTYSEVIGVLELIKFDLLIEAKEQEQSE